MANEGILRLIEDFEQTISKRLESEDFVVVDLFELRPDEIEHLRRRYSERNYFMEFGNGFPAPGNSEVHPYVVIRRGFFNR